MRSCVYNLEYNILDKIGRAKKTIHVGVFSSVEEVESVKSAIMLTAEEDISFNVFVVEDLFTR